MLEKANKFGMMPQKHCCVPDFYVREMLPPEQQNFSSVMKYLRRAKTEEDEMGNPKPSQLDCDMMELQRKLEKATEKRKHTRLTVPIRNTAAVQQGPCSPSCLR